MSAEAYHSDIVLTTQIYYNSCPCASPLCAKQYSSGKNRGVRVKVLYTATPRLIKQQWSFPMPKMKSKSSAKKRFKVLGNGGVKRAHAFKRHILTKKTTKNKRQLRGTSLVNERDMASIHKMLPYA